MTDTDATSTSEDQESPQDTRQENVRETTTERGTFIPLIFGGAVACALGFFAAQIDSIERALGLSGTDQAVTAALDEQDAIISDQQEQLGELQAQVASLPEPETVDLSAITDQLAGLTEQAATLDASVAQQSETLGDLGKRLTELEKRPMSEGVSPEAMAAYEAELERLQDDLRASVDAQKTEIADELTRLRGGVDSSRSEIESLVTAAKDSETEAQRQANLALSRASMSRIVAAVESGAPFADAVVDLAETADTDLPAALTDQAANGVPTLIALQDEFPDLARSALAAARQTAAAEGEGGVLSFIERRLGARSVTPQDGNSPDAVLSRAEAALRNGQLTDVLTEIDALPTVSKDVLADWTAKATARNGALQAADSLMSSLSTN